VGLLMNQLGIGLPVAFLVGLFAFLLFSSTYIIIITRVAYSTLSTFNEYSDHTSDE